VIAALAAAGYPSSDLIGEHGTILDQVDLDASNIWGGVPFKAARSPSRLFGAFGWTAIVLARNKGAYLIGAITMAILLAPALFISWGVVSLGLLVPLSAAAVVAVLLLGCVLSSGLASLKAFEGALNQLLRLRIADRLDRATAHRARLPHPVTFRDLQRAGCPPLSVVASDISTRQLRHFSYGTTPEVPVASAVAASVCLPVIFRPWRVGTRLHLDGGLVSNLPAWTFDAERSLDRDAWTAVVQVGDVVKEKRLWGLGILKGAVLTGFFGSGLLNVRNVDRLKAVRLKVGLKLLEFDPGLRTALEVVDEAKAATVERLVYHLRDVPELMNDICDRIRIRTERVLNLTLRTEGVSSFEGNLRVSIFVRPRDDATSLSADFQVGFEGSPDERVRLPVGGSIVGQALEDQESLYLERSDPTWPSYLARPQDRWLRKLISADINWVLCVPYVKAEHGIECIVAIDSDTPLRVDPDLVDVTMGSISEEVALMLASYLPKEAFVDGSS